MVLGLAGLVGQEEERWEQRKGKCLCRCDPDFEICDVDVSQLG